ncbi:MAG: hypothetical protein D6806_16575 [Deltaproteobacteria bacterium]|nr:MAG: hypothetical protein D6806_16575 [Deltaproteobacteria bacterium]
MKIAAGVFLIIAAVLNVIAGAGYAFGGGLASAGATIAEEAAKHVEAQGIKDGNAQAVNDARKVKQVVNDSNMKVAGGALMAFGFFLLVTFVLQIIGAIFLFMAKNKGFIFVVAALSVLAEVIGILITSFGVTNVFGLVGGVLAFIAANSFGKAAPPAQQPAQG